MEFGGGGAEEGGPEEEGGEGEGGGVDEEPDWHNGSVGGLVWMEVLEILSHQRLHALLRRVGAGFADHRGGIASGRARRRT